MIVLRQFVDDRRRSLMGWAIAVVGITAFSLAVYPSIRDASEFNDFVDSLPKAMQRSLGLDSGVLFTSAPGYLQSRLFASFLPVLAVVFAVSVGTRALGTSEEEGSLELLLTNPIARRRVFVERAGGMVALVVAFGVVSAASVLGLAPMFGALDGVDVGGLLGACAAVTALALLHASAAFVAGAVWGRRGRSIAIGSAVAVGGYVIQVVAAAAEAVRPLRWLSPWHWLLARNMLVEGVDWVAVMLPIAVSVVLVAGGAVAFERRDLR